MRTAFFLLGVVLGLPSAVSAQGAPAPRPGTWVRVHARELSGTGLVVVYDDGDLRLALPASGAGSVADLRRRPLSDTVTIPAQEITRLEIYQGRKSGAGTGALVGGLIGVVGGVVGGIATCTDTWLDCSAAGGAAVGGMAVGAAGTLVGSLIGLAIRSDRWTEVTPPAAVRPTVVGLRGGGLGVGASLTW
jgi:hypothetical protein